MIEISIKVSDGDTSLTCKYLEHDEGLCLSHDDERLKSLVDQTVSKLKGSPEDILIRIKYTW